jgi:Arc/MetJ-type ribon-helix-helix transcriptional regulator
MTSTITVRLSEKEKRQLEKHGKISEVVREALRTYLRRKDSERIVSRLKELQKTKPLGSAVQDDLDLIRADRQR